MATTWGFHLLSYGLSGDDSVLFHVGRCCESWASSVWIHHLVDWWWKLNLYPRKPTAVLLECAMRRGGTFSTCVQSCTWHHMKGGLTQLVCGDSSWGDWCAGPMGLTCQGAADRGNHKVNPLSFSLRFLSCRSSLNCDFQISISVNLACYSKSLLAAPRLCLLEWWGSGRKGSTSSKIFWNPCPELYFKMHPKNVGWILATIQDAGWDLRATREKFCSSSPAPVASWAYWGKRWEECGWAQDGGSDWAKSYILEHLWGKWPKTTYNHPRAEILGCFTSQVYIYIYM